MVQASAVLAARRDVHLADVATPLATARYSSRFERTGQIERAAVDQDDLDAADKVVAVHLGWPFLDALDRGHSALVHWLIAEIQSFTTGRKIKRKFSKKKIDKLNENDFTRCSRRSKICRPIGSRDSSRSSANIRRCSATRCLAGGRDAVPLAVGDWFGGGDGDDGCLRAAIHETRSALVNSHRHKVRPPRSPCRRTCRRLRFAVFADVEVKVDIAADNRVAHAPVQLFVHIRHLGVDPFVQVAGHHRTDEGPSPRVFRDVERIARLEAEKGVACEG